MGRKPHNVVLLLLALPAWAFPASIPVPRQEHPPILLAIPTANVLLHGQYRLSGRFQYFTTSELGAVDTTFAEPVDEDVRVQNLNYTSELLFGIENRAELGVQYGRDLSFSIKALLLREDLFWPDLVFGARNLFGSQEGSLYGVSESGILKDLQSESYMTVAKTFARSRVHLGLSVLTHSNKGLASVNAGLEQDLGAGAYMGYEVFERFSDFHQVLSLQWRYRNLVAFSVAMTEFQSWIRQRGEWGFFMAPAGTRGNGYNAPGISISLQVLGWVPRREKRTLPERVAILEVRNAQLEKELDDLREVKQRLLELEASEPDPESAESGWEQALAETAGPAMPARPKSLPEQAMALLGSIAEKAGSDLADPREVRALIEKLAALGPGAADTLIAVAADPQAGALRVPALLAMAQSRDTAYVPVLRRLCADADPRIRREALTALEKLGSRAALEDAKRLLSDPDETVALAAGEAYRRLKGPSARASGKSSPGQRAKKP